MSCCKFKCEAVILAGAARRVAGNLQPNDLRLCEVCTRPLSEDDQKAKRVAADMGNLARGLRLKTVKN